MPNSTRTQKEATPTEVSPTAGQEPEPAAVTEPPEVELGPPGFRPLREQEPPEPPPWSDAAAAWAPGSGDGYGRGGEPGDATDGGPATTTETTGSSPVSIASGLVELAATLVGMVTMLVHTIRTPGDNAVWVATTDELVGIATPLARIASRRVPKGVGASSDLTDGLEAAFTGTAYTLRNLEAERAWRQETGGGRYVPAPEPEGAPAPRRRPLVKRRGRRAPEPILADDELQGEPAVEVVPPTAPLDVLRPSVR